MVTILRERFAVRFLISILLTGMVFCCAAPAWAQGAQVVDTCGTLPQQYAPGAVRNIIQDKNGNLCTGTTITGATITTSTSSALNYTGATIGTAASSPPTLAAATRVYLDLQNSDITPGAATIWCAPDNITLAANVAGSWPLPPGGNKWWEGNFVPADKINCIASAAGAKLTIGVK